MNDATETPTASKAPGYRWIVAVVALLLFTVSTQTYLLSRALSDPSVVAEPDYYQKAVAWDQTQAQRTQNAALGWVLAPSASSDVSPSGRTLTVRLEDRTHTALTGATLRVVAFHKARSATRIQGALVENAEGEYVATLPLLREGLWELRFLALHDGQQFTYTEDLDVVGMAARTP
jgi:nitrogen fixation protein FixH